jgi:hypothetical protein
MHRSEKKIEVTPFNFTILTFLSALKRAAGVTKKAAFI